jgi:hypothetical protein
VVGDLTVSSQRLTPVKHGKIVEMAFYFIMFHALDTRPEERLLRLVLAAISTLT